MACFALQGDEHNVCRQFCIADDDCPGERKCNLGVNFSGGSASATFCSDIVEGCNVFDETTTCGEGQACYLNNQQMQCMEAGALEEGEL